MPIVVTCTSCQQPLRVPDHGVGRNVKCPACATVFVARAPDAPQAEAISSAPLSPPPPTPSRRRDEAYSEEPLSPRRRSRDDDEGPRARSLFTPLVFTVTVARDPDKEFKGQFQAKLTSEGLE